MHSPIAILVTVALALVSTRPAAQAPAAGDLTFDRLQAAYLTYREAVVRTVRSQADFAVLQPSLDKALDRFTVSPDTERSAFLLELAVVAARYAPTRVPRLLQVGGVFLMSRP